MTESIDIVQKQPGNEPTNDYAQVHETLFFGPKDTTSSAQATTMGAGTVSRFIHGMDKRSMVTNFEAKVSGEN